MQPIDPNRTLSWTIDLPSIRRSSLLQRVFHVRSIVDLTEAAKAAQSLSGSLRTCALESILSTRSDLKTSFVLDIAHELGLDEIAQLRFSKARTLNLLDDQVSAWEALVNDNLDNDKQVESFKLVVAEWKEQQSYEVLLEATKLFDRVEDCTTLSSVIEEVVYNEIGDGFSYLRKLHRASRVERPYAVAMIATRVDPQLVIKEIEAWSGSNYWAANR